MDYKTINEDKNGEEFKMKNSKSDELIRVKIFHFSYGKKDIEDHGITNIENMFTTDEKYCLTIANNDERPSVSINPKPGNVLGLSYSGRIEWNKKYYYQFAKYSSDIYKNENRNYIKSDYIFVPEEQYIELNRDPFIIIDNCFFRKESIPQEISISATTREFIDLNKNIISLKYGFLQEMYSSLFNNQSFIFLDKSQSDIRDIALIISDLILLLIPSRLRHLITFSTYEKKLNNIISFVNHESKLSFHEDCIIFDFLKQEKIGKTGSDFLKNLPQAYTHLKNLDNTNQLQDLFETNKKIDKHISKDMSCNEDLTLLPEFIDFAFSLNNIKPYAGYFNINIEKFDFCEKATLQNIEQVAQQLTDKLLQLIQSTHSELHDTLASFIIEVLSKTKFTIQHNIIEIFHFIFQTKHFQNNISKKKFKERIEIIFNAKNVNVKIFNTLVEKLDKDNIFLQDFFKNLCIHSIPMHNIDIIEKILHSLKINGTSINIKVLHNSKVNGTRINIKEFLLVDIIIWNIHIKNDDFTSFQKYLNFAKTFDKFMIIISKIFALPENICTQYIKICKNLYLYIMNRQANLNIAKNKKEIVYSIILFKYFNNIFDSYRTSNQVDDASETKKRLYKQRLLDGMIIFYKEHSMDMSNNMQNLLIKTIFKNYQNMHHFKNFIRLFYGHKGNDISNWLRISFIKSSIDQLQSHIGVLSSNTNTAAALIKSIEEKKSNAYNISTAIQAELLNIQTEFIYSEINDNLFIQYVLMDCYSQQPAIKEKHIKLLIDRVKCITGNKDIQKEEKLFALFVMLFKIRKEVDFRATKKILNNYHWYKSEKECLNTVGSLFYNDPHIFDSSTDPQLEFLKSVLTFFENPEKKLIPNESSKKDEIIKKLHEISEKLWPKKKLVRKNPQKIEFDEFITKIASTRLIHLKK